METSRHTNDTASPSAPLKPSLEGWKRSAAILSLNNRFDLETFLRGMETLFLYLFIFIPDYLETFLRGMETGLYTPAASWTKCLETFLRGMETLGDKSWAAGGGGTLKPSLEGWKRFL